MAKNKKTILFIEPELRTDKLGLLYLSAVLKQAGHDVDMVQCTSQEAWLDVARRRPDFIMYSVTTGNHRWYIERNRRLKARHTFTSVMGGTHFTFFPEDGLDDPAVDYVVRGPAEDVIADLVEHPPAEKLVMGTVPDMEALPPPDRAILYKYDEFGKSRMKRFIACRDCAWACTYCFNHLYHRIFKEQRHRFYQTTSPRKMVDEIKAVRARWGLELAYFNDDDLARNHGWLGEFCGLFKRELGLQFCGSVRADSLTENVVAMMADAGCTFMNVALESSNPATQRLLRRGSVTNGQIAQACEWFAKYGVKVRLQNMVGLPVDDPLGDALETLEFNQGLPITDSSVAIFQPFPKTDAWKRCLETGLIDEETECKKFTDDTVLDFPEPTRGRINRLAKWWYLAHKWNLDRSVVLELIDLPLAEEQKELMQQARWKEAARVLYGLK